MKISKNLVGASLLVCSTLAFTQPAELVLYAEQGNAKAQFNLGVMFDSGQGVAQNYAEAYFWLSLAASQNDEAREIRDLSARRLTPQEVNAVQARTAAWRPKPQT